MKQGRPDRVQQCRAEQPSAERAGNQDDVMQAEVSSLGGTLVERMGIEILELSAERVVATMPVAGNRQSGGPMHAGASCVLAETLAWFGSVAHGGPERIATGIEISATHHRIADAGAVTGVATRVHGGSTLAVYDVEITDCSGRRVSTARLTCLLSDRGTGGKDDGNTASG